MLYSYDQPKNKQQSSQNYDWVVEYGSRIGLMLAFLAIQPYKGLINRIRNKWEHLVYILLLMAICGLAVWFGLFDKLHRLYPDSFWVGLIPIKYKPQLYFMWGSIVHIYCAIWRFPWLRKEVVSNRAFEEMGLVPRTNKRKAKFLADYPVDKDQRCMVVSNPGVPIAEWKKRKTHIEAQLGIYITDIDFGDETSRVQILYRKTPFSPSVSYDEFQLGVHKKPYEFSVGLGLDNRKVFCTLQEMVHLLVAGETGGGKSSFLRQFVVDLLKCPLPLKLYLVDLKGGVEFLPFKGQRNVTLVKDYQETVMVVAELNKVLDERLVLFEAKRVNDIEAYEATTKQKLPRLVVVIDECAEIFSKSAGYDPTMENVTKSLRFKVGRLARLARAVGIHLVLATQRPDKDAIDMQTKDNLVSRLCFRVSNDHASQMVLRDGKAAKLPQIKGRAIWKGANQELQVQVPYLDQQQAKQLLVA